MKAILEFDLNDEADRKDHTRCMLADYAYIALYEITSMLRSADKYDSLPGFNGDLEKHADMVDFLQDRIAEIIRDNGITNLINY